MNVLTEPIPTFTNSYSSLSTPRTTSQPAPRAISVWLVDDDQPTRCLIASLLDGKEGIQCGQQFSSAEAVLEALAHEPAPEGGLLDVNMGGQTAIAPLPFIKTLAP